MGLNNPQPGLNYVPEYQIPGLPWITSSLATGIVRYDFPMVAMGITVKNNSSGTMSMAFTANGFASSNYLTLLASEAFSAEVRCKSIFVSGSGGAEFSIFATLTNIPARAMPMLTSSILASNGAVNWEGIG